MSEPAKTPQVSKDDKLFELPKLTYNEKMCVLVALSVRVKVMGIESGKAMAYGLSDDASYFAREATEAQAMYDKILHFF